MSFLGTPGFMAPNRASQGPSGAPMRQPKNVVRDGESTLWSSQMHTGGAALASTQALVFQTPIDGTGQGFTRSLSIAETNLKVGGQVPDGAAFDVWGMASQIMFMSAAGDAQTTMNLPINETSDAAAVTTLVNLQYNCVLQWFFNMSLIDIAPLLLVGAGGGLFGPVAVNANADTVIGTLNNGPGSMWVYNQPVMLPANQLFGVQLTYGDRAAVAPTVNIVIRIALCGAYRAVIDSGA